MISSSVATDYTVGDGAGWMLGLDYDSWTAGKTFSVGDSLVFKYSRGQTVIEASLGEYTSCALENSISKLASIRYSRRVHKSDTTIITLETPGTHYFISAEPGNCTAGMKIVINVSANELLVAPTPTCNGCSPLASPDGSSNITIIPSTINLLPQAPSSKVIPPLSLNLPWKKSGSAPAGLSNVLPVVAVFLLALVVVVL
ncbi:hypothetical protein AgCh_007143 [Apium graveolens]